MPPADPFHGIFTREPGLSGPRLSRVAEQPATMPDPHTGRQLRIATVELSGAICPLCAHHGEGGFVSFVADLRLAYACPNCAGFVWVAGA